MANPAPDDLARSLMEPALSILEELYREAVPDDREWKKTVKRFRKTIPPPSDTQVQKYSDSPGARLFLAVFSRLLFDASVRWMVAAKPGSRGELEEEFPISKTTFTRHQTAVYYTRRVLEKLSVRFRQDLVGDFALWENRIDTAFWEAWVLQALGELLEKGEEEEEAESQEQMEREKQDIQNRISRGDYRTKEDLKNAIFRLVYLCKRTNDRSYIVWEESLKRLHLPKVTYDQVRSCARCQAEMQKQESVGFEFTASEIAYRCEACGFGRIVWLHYPPEDYVPVIEEGPETGRKILEYRERIAREKRAIQELEERVRVARKGEGEQKGE
ncbi:MAG: hypothetical protein HY558_07820 [Euryarchaeota archaeon]|nr:hypothetical protein [Euryarchaeota archaeon]